MHDPHRLLFQELRRPLVQLQRHASPNSSAAGDQHASSVGSSQSFHQWLEQQRLRESRTSGGQRPVTTGAREGNESDALGASAVLSPSSPSAILESLGERKESARVLSKQRMDSSLTLSLAEPLDDAGDNNHGAAAASAKPAMRIEKQSSARKMRQSSKTKIMDGVDLSATLSKRLSTARLARAPSRMPQRESRDLSAGGSLDTQLSSLSLHDSDNSSHFFSIETRLGLKERLAVLQKQLGELLVQTKLAWMKCFADNSKSHGVPGGSSTRHVASREALRAANELVTKGELLVTKLHSAFSKATSTSSCPIREYQDLVEIDFRGFQQLVGRVVHHSFPLAPAMHRASQELPSPNHKELKASTCEPTLKPAVSHSVSYDLPSMKNYCAKVAPPYSSYLVKKK